MKTNLSEGCKANQLLSGERGEQGIDGEGLQKSIDILWAGGMFTALIVVIVSLVYTLILIKLYVQKYVPCYA